MTQPPPGPADPDIPPANDRAADEMQAALRRAAKAASRQVDAAGDDVDADAADIAADDAGATALAQSGSDT